MFHVKQLGLGQKQVGRFAPKFAVDFIDLAEQSRRNSGLFRGFLHWDAKMPAHFLPIPYVADIKKTALT